MNKYFTFTQNVIILSKVIIFNLILQLHFINISLLAKSWNNLNTLVISLCVNCHLSRATNQFAVYDSVSLISVYKMS